MFKLEIETDNAAFDGSANLEAELSRLLRSVAEKIRRHGIERGPNYVLQDINGNKVGFFDLS
jgi:hypothetical protein